MATTTLTSIVGASVEAEARILTGVFGREGPDGGFEVDPVLRDRIYLFSLMSNKAIAGLRTATVELQEEHLPALKATLISIMSRRWLRSYDRFSGDLIKAEAGKVQVAVAEAIAALGQPAYQVKLSKCFEAVRVPRSFEPDPAHQDDPDEFHEEESGESSNESTVHPSRIRGLIEQTPWSISESQPLIVTPYGLSPTPFAPQGAGSQRSQDDAQEHEFASGQLCTVTVVYGATPEARDAVVQAVTSLGRQSGEDLLWQGELFIEGLVWQSREDVLEAVRVKLASGQQLSVHELLPLAPKADPGRQQFWAEGFLAARQQPAYLPKESAEPAIDPDEAAELAVPRM